MYLQKTQMWSNNADEVCELTGQHSTYHLNHCPNHLLQNVSYNLKEVTFINWLFTSLNELVAVT